MIIVRFAFENLVILSDSNKFIRKRRLEQFYAHSFKIYFKISIRQSEREKRTKKSKKSAKNKIVVNN